MEPLYLALAVILVPVTLLGRSANAGSASLLLGTALAGAASIVCLAATGRPLPSGSLSLPDSVFFNVLLPPIIFNAGFSIKKRRFMAHLLPILWLGIGCTLSSTAAAAAAASGALRAMGLRHPWELQSALALGAVAACSDTVAVLQVVDATEQPSLHSVLFGEGVVNDAVAIVLLGAVSGSAAGARHAKLDVQLLCQLLLDCVRLSLASAALGVAVGLAGALLVRSVFARRHDCDREVLLLALLGVGTYALADAVQPPLSGILAVFFCGIASSHWTWHSLCPAAQALSLHAFRLCAVLMEMVLLAFSGLSIWTSSLWQEADQGRHHLAHALSLAGVLLAAIVAARVAFVAVTTAAVNTLSACTNSSTRLHVRTADAAVVCWGGLSRGAITLALAYHHFAPARSGVPAAAHQIVLAAVVLLVLASVTLSAVSAPLVSRLARRRTVGPPPRAAGRQAQAQVLAQPLLTTGSQLLPPPSSASTNAASMETPVSRNGTAGVALARTCSGDSSSSGLNTESSEGGVDSPGRPAVTAQAERAAAVASQAAALLQQQEVAVRQQLSSLILEAGGSPSSASGHSCGRGELALGTQLALARSGADNGTHALAAQRWCLEQQLRVLHELSVLQAAQRDAARSHRARAPSTAVGAADAAGRSRIHALWRSFDARYLQPVFGGREVASRTRVPGDFDLYV